MKKPRIGFQAYSPYRSFTGEGAQTESFLDRNGKDTDEGWGKRTHHTLWELGFQAYEELGSPDRDTLIQMREQCLELFPALVDFLQMGVDAGHISLVAHAEVDDDGNPVDGEPILIHEMGFEWLAHASAKVWLAIVRATDASKAADLSDLGHELVSMLNYSILLEVDNALIAYQLGDSSAFGDSIAEISEMAHLAREIKNRPLLAQKARTDVARNAAAARLANDPKQAAKAEVKKLWDDWQSGRKLHKSAAAFARFAVDLIPTIESEETVKRWDRSWRKTDKEKGD